MYATLKQFGLPAVAGSTAVLASHPLELVKSRLQLDNELRARGAKSQYNGWLDCVKTSWARGGARDGGRDGRRREFRPGKREHGGETRVRRGRRVL